MTEIVRPKLETLVIMAIYPNQRKKAGTSRVLIKKTLTEKYNVADDKRNTTLTKNAINKLKEEKIIEGITAHSFHLTAEGVEKAKKIKASEAWVHFQDKLEGKEPTKKRASKTTTTKKSEKPAKTTKATTKKGETPTKAKKTSTKKPKATAEAKKPAAPRQKRVHYDAVMPADSTDAQKATKDRAERAKRRSEGRQSTTAKTGAKKAESMGTGRGRRCGPGKKAEAAGSAQASKAKEAKKTRK